MNGFLEFGILTLLTMVFVTGFFGWTLMNDTAPGEFQQPSGRSPQPAFGALAFGALEGGIPTETISIMTPKVERYAPVA